MFLKDTNSTVKCHKIFFLLTFLTPYAIGYFVLVLPKLKKFTKWHKTSPQNEFDILLEITGKSKNITFREFYSCHY